MHRLTVTIAALLLSAPLFAELVFPPQEDAVQKYFALACTYTECGNLKAPMVIFGDTGRALGYYYFGTHTVFVTEDCFVRTADQTKCEAILIHEMTHYIVDHNEGIRDNCASESRAWDVYNAYVMDAGRLDLVRPNWQESYPLCAKSPAPSR